MTKKTCKEKRMLKKLRGVYKHCIDTMYPFAHTSQNCKRLMDKVKSLSSKS